MPRGQLKYRVAGIGTATYSDALDDLGTDDPTVAIYTGKRYARDPEVRKAVLKRAGGRCEYCGKLGFQREDGPRYLECHHILALADEGPDRPTNVIALCPGDHREAHFGARRAEIEVEMTAKVIAAEGRKRGGQSRRTDGAKQNRAIRSGL